MKQEKELDGLQYKDRCCFEQILETAPYKNSNCAAILRVYVIGTKMNKTLER